MCIRDRTSTAPMERHGARSRTSSCSRSRLRLCRLHSLMRPFRYHRPASSADALTALGAPDSVAFGGGTDLLVTMKEGLAEPAHLVDVRHLRGARDITVRADGSARIGGAVRIADLAAH